MILTTEQIAEIVGRAKMKELKPLPAGIKETVESGIDAEEILQKARQVIRECDN